MNISLIDLKIALELAAIKRRVRKLECIKDAEEINRERKQAMRKQKFDDIRGLVLDRIV